MTRAIRLIRLDLEGFGVWRDATSFHFPDRFGVLSLPNEAGKSTMTEGLRYLLFGLPGEKDASVPGIGRFRSWGSEGPCRGRLDLRVGDRQLRIRRDFASHKTLVEMIDSDGRPRERLFDGIANPAGKTPVREEYRIVLREILGDLADPGLKGDLFAASFLVSQPIRIEETAGKALGRLVSGVGRIGGESAREALFNRVKALTRETRELELVAPGKERSAAQRSDGEIERLIERISRLRAERDAAREAFQRQVLLEDAVARAETAAAEAAREEESARLDRDGLNAYRKDLDRAAEGRAALQELEKAQRLYDEEIMRASQSERSCETEFPDLADAPEDLAARIDSAAAIETSLGGARSLAADWTAKAEALRREIESPENARWRKIPAIESDPPLWIARIRAEAGRFCELLGTRIAREEQKARLEAQRQALAAVGTLPDEVQDGILRLDEMLRDIEEKQALAAGAADSRGLLAEELERRREDFARRYAAIEGIDTDRHLALIEARAARHRKLAEVTAAAASAREEVLATGDRRSWLRSTLIAAAAAALAAAIALALGLPDAVAIAAPAVVLAAVYLVLAREPRRMREARARVDQREREIADLQGLLRSEFLPSIPGVADDAEAPARAREIFAQRDIDAQALHNLQESLTACAGAEDPSAMLESLRDRREKLLAESRKLEEATGRPAPDAVRDHREMGAAIARVVSEIEASDGELIGDRGLGRVDPLSLPLAELAPAWSGLREAAEAMEIHAPTVAALHEALNGIPAERWDRWAEEARRFVELRSSEAHALEAEGEAKARCAKLAGDLDAAIEGIGAARIAASEGSIIRLRERWRAREELARGAVSIREAAAHILASARQGPYADRAALAAAIAEADEKLRHARRSAEEARDASDLLRRYESLEPAEGDRLRREIDARAETAVRRLDDARMKLETARAELRAWSPPVRSNIAQLDLEILSREEALRVLEERRDAAAKAWHLLGEAIEEYRSAHRATLEEKIDARFRAITGREERRISLGPGLEVRIRDGSLPVVEAQLSQGARDQLAFSLRLAVADLIAGEILPPVILDDPFVHSDAERLERIRAALESAAAERQVIFLTQDARLATWGEPIRVTPA